MLSAPNTPERIEIIRSSRQESGVHTSERLAGRMRRGELLRIRRGLYIPARRWAEAPPWIKYHAAIAALATARNAIFCRESALVLHGIPLLSTPTALHARTTDAGDAKSHRPTPMMGAVAPQEFRKRYLQNHPEARALSSAAFTNVPLTMREAACPEAVTRSEMRIKLGTGEHTIPTIALGSDALDSVSGPDQGYVAEPLGLAAVDTASRTAFTEAVVILDALKARGDDAVVVPWLRYLRTQRQRARWDRAWQFADGRAESALESESRVVLARIHCPAPTLQKVVHTSIGPFRMDFCWENERVAGEVDGKAKYFDPQYTNGLDPAEVHYREKQRREALEAEGWQLVRWGKAELQNTQELVKRLNRAGLRPVS